MNKIGHRILVAVVGLMVLLFAVALPIRPAALSIVGDAAPVLKEAMPDGWRPARSLDVIVVRRAENLRHLPSGARLCRGVCDAQQSVFLELLPGGMRKTVVFNLNRIPGGAALDTGDALPDSTVTCLVDTILAEGAGLMTRPSSPCLADRAFRLRLPWGL